MTDRRGYGNDVELGTVLTRIVLDFTTLLLGAAMCFGAPTSVAMENGHRWGYATMFLALGVLLLIGRAINSSRMLMVADVIGVSVCLSVVGCLAIPTWLGHVSPVQAVLWLIPATHFAIQGVLRARWR